MDALLRYALLNISWLILVFELFIIFICIVLIVIFKVTYASKRKHKHDVMQRLSDLFIKAWEVNDPEAIDNSPYSPNALVPKQSIDIPKDLQGFNHIVETLESFDQRIDDNRWQWIRKDISDRYLAPRAKKYATSRSWLDRQLAARSYYFNPTKETHPQLDKLLHDPKLIVRVFAAIAITQANNRELYCEVIKQMARETPLSRFSYRDAIIKGNTEKFTWIEELLKSEKDSNIQAICMDLLSTRTVQNHFHTILPLIYGEDTNCRLQAIKILKQIPSDEAQSLLLQLLSDGKWEIRAETLKDLDPPIVREGISRVEGLLNDPNWFVRLQAALAIKRLGGQGLKILSSQHPSDKPSAYEISQYVMALPD